MWWRQKWIDDFWLVSFVTDYAPSGLQVQLNGLAVFPSQGSLEVLIVNKIAIP